MNALVLKTILRLRSEGVGPRSIARQLGLSPGCVSGAIWRAEHPRVPKPLESRRGEANPRAKITEAHAREILRRRRAGETATGLAREFGIDVSSVSLITTGKRWAHLQLEADQ